MGEENKQFVVDLENTIRIKNEFISTLLFAMLTKKQIEAIKTIGGNIQGITSEKYYPSIVLKTYFKFEVNDNSYGAGNDDGVPFKYLSKFSMISNVNCSYYLIGTNGNTNILYDGKPERIIIGQMTDEELESRKISNEVMNFEYYRINL
jgi:hypothetical protein